MSLIAELRQAVIGFVLEHGHVFSEEPAAQASQDYESFGHKFADTVYSNLQEVKTEFVGDRLSGLPEGNLLSITHCHCICGKYDDVRMVWTGTIGDVLCRLVEEAGC